MPYDQTLRTTGKTDKQVAKITLSKFEVGDTKLSTKFTVGGLYILKKFTCVSKKALAVLKKENPKAVLADGIDGWKMKSLKKLKITREHVIPVDDLYLHFKKLFDEKKLNEKTLLNWLPKLFIGVITEEENKKLVAAGLNKKMPEGWWESDSLDPLDRYRAAGLDDDIWVDWSKNE